MIFYNDFSKILDHRYSFKEPSTEICFLKKVVHLIVHRLYYCYTTVYSFL